MTSMHFLALCSLHLVGIAQGYGFESSPCLTGTFTTSDCCWAKLKLPSKRRHLTYGLDATVESEGFFDGDEECSNIEWRLSTNRRLTSTSNPHVFSCQIIDTSGKCLEVSDSAECHEFNEDGWVQVEMASSWNARVVDCNTCI